MKKLSRRSKYQLADVGNGFSAVVAGCIIGRTIDTWPMLSTTNLVARLVLVAMLAAISYGCICYRKNIRRYWYEHPEDQT